MTGLLYDPKSSEYFILFFFLCWQCVSLNDWGSLTHLNPTSSKFPFFFLFGNNTFRSVTGLLDDPKSSEFFTLFFLLDPHNSRTFYFVFLATFFVNWRRASLARKSVGTYLVCFSQYVILYNWAVGCFVGSHRYFFC